MLEEMFHPSTGLKTLTRGICYNFSLMRWCIEISSHITCVFDRDVSVDGRLPVLDGRKCGDGALLQLPEPNQDEAA